MKNGKVRFMTTVSLLLLIVGTLKCSVYMAAKQPEKKNLEVMQVGTPRSRVLAEFGQPVSTEIRDGKKVDVFSLVQGYSKPAKAGRAALHATTDVLTSGTSEIVGTPTEVVLSGSKVAYEITYDENDRVEKAVALTEKSQKKAPKGLTEPPGESSEEMKKQEPDE